jgi:hypothetical protein
MISEMLTEEELMEKLRASDRGKLEDLIVILSTQVANLIDENRWLLAENAGLRGDRPRINLPPSFPPISTAWWVFMSGNREVDRLPVLDVTEEEAEAIAAAYPPEWDVKVVWWEGVFGVEEAGRRRKGGRRWRLNFP